MNHDTTTALVAVRTGTMGWSYDDWRGPFYTPDTTLTRLLENYARIPGFDTVELDTTFYGVPRASTIAGWDAQTPSGFLFSAKVPKALTHERRLVEAAPLARDFGNLLFEKLGPKLGGLLLQLPPDFSVEERSNLETFVVGITENSDSPLPWVVEFRHASWVGTDIATTLAHHGVACVTTERLDVGGPLRYIRLLGTTNSVARFDARQFDRGTDLDTWAARLDAARQSSAPREQTGTAPILVYVRNFFEGHAPATINELRRRLHLPVSPPPGAQQMSLF